MYTVNVLIEGDAPLLQHAFSPTAKKSLQTASKARTGVKDYSLEWMDTMYVNADGLLCQPSVHLERSMIGAAGNFKVTGKRGKTWKKSFLAYVLVEPELVVHLRAGAPVVAPGEELIENPTEHLAVDVRRVVVQRAAVARSRLKVEARWQLRFDVRVIDDQLPAEVLKDVLTEAGRSEGIGDFRPKFGRFHVVEFKE